MMRLLLRYVDHLDRGDWHICLASDQLPDGTVVTLQAICTQWVFGTLTYQGVGTFYQDRPGVRVCDACLAEYHASVEAQLSDW